MFNADPPISDQDQYWMQMALALAREAAAKGEVPVGAIIVDENQKIVSQAYNRREELLQVSAHAEMIAIAEACRLRRNWRLVPHLTLFVTLEPCIMCAGAIYQSRLERVVFGTRDPKAGALGSLYAIQNDRRLNHAFQVTEGIGAEESAGLLKDFFKHRR